MLTNIFTMRRRRTVTAKPPQPQQTSRRYSQRRIIFLISTFIFIVFSVLLIIFNLRSNISYSSVNQHSHVSKHPDDKKQMPKNLVIIDQELEENDLIFDSNYLVRDGKSLTCFLSAGYSDDESSMDKVVNVTKYQQEGVRFYFFTNEEAKNAATPGWEKIIHSLPNFRRRITQSRWPKFQGYHHPTIQSNCQTILYCDASSSIKYPMKTVLKLASIVKESKEGLAQHLHKKGRKSISEEFEAILRLEKDNQVNVNASLEWFHAQPDFQNEMPIYENNYFLYDPDNLLVRNMTDFFWNRYSMEVDSWRDQPLWTYTLFHHGFSPLVPNVKLLVSDTKRQYGGHAGYVEPKAPKI